MSNKFFPVINLKINFENLFGARDQTRSAWDFRILNFLPKVDLPEKYGD